MAKTSDKTGPAISELQMVGLLSRMFGFRQSPNTVAEMLRILDEDAEDCGVPFRLQGSLWVSERLPVRRSVLWPRRTRLVDYLDSRPEHPLIVADLVEAGQEGLHLVRYSSSEADIPAWVEAMQGNVNFTVGQYKGDLILSAPFLSFRRGA